MIYKNTVSIIGGAGHVGFPLALALANKNININLIDLNIEFLNKIERGIVPFYELGAKKILLKVLKNKKLSFSSELETVKKSKYIIVCIGTPINNKLKPEIKKFYSFSHKLFKHVKKNQIIIIRSSLFPGIIDKIKFKYQKINKNISYCPERIVQSKALVELPILPQIISGLSRFAINELVKLFKKITKNILVTSVKEAELIKLYSNANRYINFAIANQLYLMCQKNNVDFEKVRKFMRFGYERNINIPKAGFSAGPCLLKDTMQLTSFYRGKFDLGLAAMKINENDIIKLIIEKIKKISNYKRVSIGILGVTFKAETDDIRDSLSIKLIKKLKKMKLKIIYTDEYYKDNSLYDLKTFLRKAKIIILGAPHQKYKKIKFSSKIKLIDIWGIIKN